MPDSVTVNASSPTRSRRRHTPTPTTGPLATDEASTAAETQRHRAEQAEARTERVYLERAHLTALVARLLADREDTYGAVLAYNSEADPATCPPEWPVLYLELPGGGQLCYHITPEQLPLFAHVDTVATDDPRARWDRADKDTYHRRIRQFVAAGPPAHTAHADR